MILYLTQQAIKTFNNLKVFEWLTLRWDIPDGQFACSWLPPGRPCPSASGCPERSKPVTDLRCVTATVQHCIDVASTADAYVAAIEVSQAAMHADGGRNEQRIVSFECSVIAFLWFTLMLSPSLFTSSGISDCE